MTKERATALDAKIVSSTDDWFRSVAPLMLEMKRDNGHVALGFKTFRDYCAHVDDRLGGKMAAYRLMERAQVEANLGVAMPAQHAYALADLPDVGAQREVFEKVMSEYSKPTEQNYRTYVDRWLRSHGKATRRSPGQSVKKDSDGWTKADLEEDGELSTALDRIETVYGNADRKAIQDGSIGLSRKDIIGLAAFHVSKIKQVHYLITVNHWDLAASMKFVNEQPDKETTVHELQNHALAAPGFSYTCQVEGFDIRITACKAFATKIKG